MIKRCSPPEVLEARIAPASFRWSGLGSGLWNDQANWFNETTNSAANGFPNAADDVAKFTTSLAGFCTVTIDGVGVTAGSLLFDASNVYSIAASNGGSLMLSSSTMATIAATKVNGDAPHSIAAPLVLGSNVRFSSDLSSTFSISTSISESASGRGLTKAGPGTLLLTNPIPTPMPNTFTGTTTVEEGTLTLVKTPGTNAFGGPLVVGGFGRNALANVLGTSQIPDAGAVQVDALGMLTFNITETLGPLTINGGTVSLGSNQPSTILAPSSLTMNGGTILMNFSTQTVNLVGTMTATSDANGPALISGGQLSLGGNGRVIQVNDGPNAQDLTVSSAVFSGGLTKAGAGTLRLSGTTANTYTGTTTVNAGTLELAKSGVTAIAGALVVGDGTGGAEADQVRLINDDQIANNVAVVVNSSGLLDLNAMTETVAALSISSGHVTTGGAGGGLTLSTSLTLNAGRLTVGAAGSQVVLPTTVTVNTAGQSLIDGAGSLVTPSSAVTFNVSNGSADVDLLVDVPIGGTAGLNKVGAGTLTLSSSNTYSGDTLVFGRLIVNGSIGNVLMGSSQGTLAGTGTVGSISGNNGTLAPGTSPGVLKTGAFSALGAIAFDIDGATPGSGAGFHDQISVTGTVDLSNTAATFNITAGFAQGDQYVLIQNDGSDAVVGNFTNLFEGSILTSGGRRYILTYQGGDGNDVVLTPEQAFFIEGDSVPGGDDVFTVSRDATTPWLVNVSVQTNFGPVTTRQVSLHQYANIVIRGGTGADTLVFDAANGYFNSSLAFRTLIFEGGTGGNTVFFSDQASSSALIEYYVPGLLPGQALVSLNNGFTVGLEDVVLFQDNLSVGEFVVLPPQMASGKMTFAEAEIGGQNRVAVEGLLAALVGNKSTISLNGGTSIGTFEIHPSTIPGGLSSIGIVAGSGNTPMVRVHGEAANDTFTFDGGSLTRTGQAPIAFTGNVRLELLGGAGNDLFVLPSGSMDVRVEGGAGTDTLSFAGGSAAVSLGLDLVGVAQSLNTSGAQLTLGDLPEAVVGTGLADTFFARPAAAARSLDGGAGNDLLVFDALGTDTTHAAGVLATPGYGSLTAANLEKVTLVNVPAQPALGETGNTFAAPLDFATGAKSSILAVADLNGDGRADFVTVHKRMNTLGVGLSTSTALLLPAIQKLTGGEAPAGVAVIDLDGDGDRDIAVSNSATGTIGLLFNDGTGGFADPVAFASGKAPGLLRAGDLDGDGDADLAVVLGGTKLGFFKNNGTGAFTKDARFSTGASGVRDFTLADLDSDGDRDLAVLHGGGQLVVRTNDGAGVFSAPTTLSAGPGATALAIADFNADGKTDYAVTHGTLSRFVSVLLGDGTGGVAGQLRTAYSLGLSARAVTAADFDGDGRTDLAVANAVGGSVRILRGLGTGGFVRGLDLFLEDQPARRLAAVTLGDLDGDGRDDLFALGSAKGEVSVLTRA